MRRVPRRPARSGSVQDLNLLVGAADAGRPHLSLIPGGDVDEFYLGLEHFNLTKDGKNGFFPANTQFAVHFPEFLRHGYRSGLGTVEVRFTVRDGSRVVAPHSVCLVDGQLKVLLMATIVGFVRELELSSEEQNMLQHVLRSFRSIRCTYKHFENPAHFHLHSLRGLPKAHHSGGNQNIM